VKNQPHGTCQDVQATNYGYGKRTFSHKTPRVRKEQARRPIIRRNVRIPFGGSGA
jgi:hypothetical protein